MASRPVEYSRSIRAAWSKEKSTSTSRTAAASASGSSDSKSGCRRHAVSAVAVVVLLVPGEQVRRPCQLDDAVLGTVMFRTPRIEPLRVPRLGPGRRLVQGLYMGVCCRGHRSERRVEQPDSVERIYCPPVELESPTRMRHGMSIWRRRSSLCAPGLAFRSGLTQGPARRARGLPHCAKSHEERGLTCQEPCPGHAEH